MHKFVVVENMVASAILGVDFLQENKLVLDFSSLPVTIRQTNASFSPDPLAILAIDQICPVYETTRASRAKICVFRRLRMPLLTLLMSVLFPYMGSLHN